MAKQKKRSVFKRFIRRLPLPVLAILVGLIVGTGVWVVIDSIQTRAVHQLFEEELKNRLDKQAQESMTRFHHFINQYAAINRLLGNHQILTRYLTPLFWGRDEFYHETIYQDEVPAWLPGELLWQTLPKPSHVLLIDRYGKVREEYRLNSNPLDEEIKAYFDWKAGISQSFLTEVSGLPYLILIEQASDESDNIMGALVLVVPIDTAFLQASQQSVSPDGAIVALLKKDTKQIMVSSDDQQVLKKMTPEHLSSEFVVTSQPLMVKSSLDMLFGTFIPRSGTVATVERVLELERRQRWIGAGVFILVFSLLFMFVSLRLNRVLNRISDFARRALGMSGLEVKRGNLLIVLEEWIREFSELVLMAREDMRVKHEDEIRASKALKAAIMDTSLDSIVTIEESGRIIDFNPTAEKTFGISASDAIGKNIQSLIIAEHCRKLFKNTLHACLSVSAKNHSVGRVEMQARRHDGTFFSVEIAIKPLLIKDYFLFTVYLHDISVRKQQEQEIHTLAAIPSESPMPILRINNRGVIIYANQPSRPLLDYWGVEFLQKLPVYWIKQVEKVLADDHEAVYEVEDNERYYSLLLVPISDSNYVNIYASDVTKTRQAEAEARQHQTELVHVCRVSTMGEMATGIAHELNQPLSAIMNYAKGSQRRIKLNPTETDSILQALEKISHQADRAGEIIKRMRGMLAKQPAIRDTADLNQLVQEVCSFVEFESRKLNVKIVTELFGHPLQVQVDLVQIEQVILNIVRNAFDVLQSLNETDKMVLIKTGISENNMAFVSVEDNGTGMSETTKQHLFHPFYTTKETGMGMGLAISQTIIDDHMGNISVDSWQGQGTRFMIELPLSAMTDNSIVVSL
ncbi:MAG: PAS domain S-box protein [Gammaproteobacteria bacterium]